MDIQLIKQSLFQKKLKKNKNIKIRNIFFRGPAEKAIAKGIHLGVHANINHLHFLPQRFYQKLRSILS